MTIKTNHTIESAAIEFTKLYENSKNKNALIIGFDESGNVVESYEPNSDTPDIIVHEANSLLEDWNLELENYDEWTAQDRQDVIDFYHWLLRGESHKETFDVEFKQ